MKIRQKFVNNLTNEFVIRHFPVDEQVFVTILGLAALPDRDAAGLGLQPRDFRLRPRAADGPGPPPG